MKRAALFLLGIIAIVIAVAAGGCGGSTASQPDQQYFTRGSQQDRGAAKKAMRDAHYARLAAQSSTELYSPPSWHYSKDVGLSEFMWCDEAIKDGSHVAPDTKLLTPGYTGALTYCTEVTDLSNR
jgi:hypothetical protein